MAKALFWTKCSEEVTRDYRTTPFEGEEATAAFAESLHPLSSAWYDFRMKSLKIAPILDRLVAPLAECLTPESARRVLALKADATLQALVDDLADRHSEGRLTPDEDAEYGRYVSYATFVAILKSKARQLLAGSPGE
jgi:hypothetical protein